MARLIHNTPQITIHAHAHSHAHAHANWFLTFSERPVNSHLEGFVEIPGVHGNDAFGADADGDVVEERLGQVLLDRKDVFLAQIRPDQTHAAVYVETHAACVHGEQGGGRRRRKRKRKRS